MTIFRKIQLLALASAIYGIGFSNTLLADCNCCCDTNVGKTGSVQSDYPACYDYCNEQPAACQNWPDRPSCSS